MWERKLFGADSPRAVYTAYSPYNGKINVWEHDRSFVLEAAGYQQSVSLNTPDLPKRYWFKATEEVAAQLENPQRALVLGVGGATILHLLSRKFPRIKIVGVEIDEEILKIARQFFELEKIPNLEVVTSDGGEYVSSYQGEPFDLVFVDAYLGGNFPLHFEEEQFLRHLRRISQPKGVIVINRAGGFDRRKFQELLERVFAKVEMVKIPLPGFLGGMGGNFLYFCQ